jgi:hypothetical protein
MQLHPFLTELADVFASGSLDGVIVIWRMGSLTPLKKLNYPEKFFTITDTIKSYTCPVNHLLVLGAVCSLCCHLIERCRGILLLVLEKDFKFMIPRLENVLWIVQMRMILVLILSFASLVGLVLSRVVSCLC